MAERAARRETVTPHESHNMESVLTAGGRIVLNCRVCGCSNLKADRSRIAALDLCPTVLEVVTEVGLG